MFEAMFGLNPSETIQTSKVKALLYGDMSADDLRKEGLRIVSVDQGIDITLFVSALKAGNYEDVINIASKRTKILSQLGECIELALKEDGVPAQIIQRLFDLFWNVFNNSHKSPLIALNLLPYLWKKRMLKEIKDVYLHLLSIQDENGKLITACIKDFAKHADWSDDPKDFSLEACDYCEYNFWKANGFEMRRIKYAPFESEIAYIEFTLRQPEVVLDYRQESRVNSEPLGKVVNLKKEKISSLISRLKELGADTEKYSMFMMLVQYMTTSNNVMPSEKMISEFIG